MRFLDYTAPGIGNLNPYVPGKPVSQLERELGISNAVKLASNENPIGPSTKAKAAITAQLADLSRYPDGGGHELRHALARRHGVEPECITLGNGSNDVLDLIARTFLSPGFESVMSEHAFAVYPISTQAAGAVANAAPAHDGSRGPRFGHDLEAMLQRVNELTRVVFIANPNNPTGTWLPADQMQNFISALPAHIPVVVDEAYFEYVEEDAYPDTSRWISRYANLIVTRTFSKAYGLAGLRIGYGISSPEIAELLNRVRQPFNVNSLALAAALAALDDQEHIARSVAINRSGMQQWVSGLESLGIGYIPSVGNFLCVEIGANAGRLDSELQRAGCIVRPVANYGLPRHLRISIGLAEENAVCLAALQKLLA